MKYAKTLYAEGGFHLTKFFSNSKHVLLSIPEGDRGKGLHDQELRLGTLLTEKAFGVDWYMNEDNLHKGFCINFKEKPSTRCGMLSMASSIHDPLGLVSPFFVRKQTYHTDVVSQSTCLG